MIKYIYTSCKGELFMARRVILSVSTTDNGLFVGMYETSNGQLGILELLLIAINKISNNDYHTLTGNSSVTLEKSDDGKLEVCTDFTAADSLKILSEVALKTIRKDIKWLALRV